MYDQQLRMSVNQSPVLGIRHLQALLIFLGIASLYMQRHNVGISIVAMTNANATNTDFPEFAWSEKQQALVLSSFYWGYILTRYLGEYFSRLFGVKRVMFWSAMGSAVLSLATAFCVKLGDGWTSYCAVRFLQGLFQALTADCVDQHLVRWCPSKEHSRLSALSYTGAEFGSVLAMLISGIVARSSWGWPGISYVAAGFGFVWCLLWFVFSTNYPKQSRFIGQPELEYIESTRDVEGEGTPTPWRTILMSSAVWGLILGRCTIKWGLSTLQALLPSYMVGVLQLDMLSIALYSALPFLAMWSMVYVYMVIADFVLERKWLNPKTLRRLLNTSASWISASTLLAIGFVDGEQTASAIVLMTISVGVNSGAIIGSTIDSMNLSPSHASRLMSFVNTAVSTVPILTPLVFSAVLDSNNNRSQWQIVFLVASVILFIGNGLLLLKGLFDFVATKVKKRFDAAVDLSLKVA
ncbi:putative inorganic phosphate cotransporter [Scaptodrosophila lebanonensis]|uniref:Putative inorganic phosphate cotransporter n=1 Tax=Drosophila lebanonensis TaxID=7225 RepID=A0A6J2UF40_DROLE|nr:putative inorganic phosphate cotransporter [Scaptodrosophila lebanonensis]